MESANGYCDADCEGYRLDPVVGDLWPGERREDFGYTPELVEIALAINAKDKRIAELEVKLGDAVCAIDAWSNTCAPLLSPQAIIDAATFADEARALLKGGE
jgi:hypothetical protein